MRDEIDIQGIAAPPRVHPPRILIVDPDMRFARLLGTFLVARGWQAKHLDHPREALARLDKLEPDLVCLELVGPEPAGFDFVALLQRLPSPPPVVICTRFAAAAGWDNELLARLGVRALVTRPSSFEAMDAIFRSCLAPEVFAAFPQDGADAPEDR